MTKKGVVPSSVSHTNATSVSYCTKNVEMSTISLCQHYFCKLVAYLSLLLILELAGIVDNFKQFVNK